ncbi:O-antigen ligase family protein [Verrucomicrobia bacterium]|nr:O-antigen ligase family protein [Verrucomicrobiota bacterium]
MSNFNPKKLSHRSRNRTPKLYRWADIGTEALIYFTIIFGPWAFGTVHDWAITTMNLANYGIGLLLMTKWVIRWKTEYQPARWTSHSQNDGESDSPKRDWRTKTVGFLTLYMLGYILVSILNARSTYNWDFNFFEYEETYIKWLPHTYDKAATIQSLCNFLGLACCFWGVRDWVLEKTRTERMESTSEEDDSQHMFQEEISVPSIPNRLKKLLWLLCISGGLLALIGIVQRLDGTPKLLWILEREQFGSPTQSFGPFGYRGNGASYINMILPLAVGFLMWMMQYAKSVRMKTGRKSSESRFTLIPAICMMIAAPFISLSRGGFVVLGYILLVGIIWVLFKRNLLKGQQKAGLGIILLMGIGLSYYIGWEPLLKRLNSQNLWYETQIEAPNYEEKIEYIADLPAPPYDRNHTLFMISDSQSRKFRKSYFQADLYKSGTLRTLLSDYTSKSYIQTTYTNLTEVLESGSLKLEIIRNSDGIKSIANETALIGIEKRSGKNPPTWNHPVIPNEILVHKKTALKKGEPDLQSRLLSVEPITSKASPGQNKESIQLTLDENWSFSQIFSNMSSRDRIYEDSLRMAKDYRMLGCGSGAWGTVYFLYHDADEVWDAWVHCDWLEYWINFGFFGTVPGFILLIITSISFKAKSGITSHAWMRTALNIAITGCLLHALFDFPLQVISIMHLFVILCAVKFAIRRA